MTRDLTAVGLAMATAVALLATAPTSQARLAPVAAASLSAPAPAGVAEPRPVRRGAVVVAPSVVSSPPLGVPVPAWRADDVQATRVPSPLLDPLPVDPAVEQALRRLRTAATGTPGERRPSVAALTALDAALDQVGDPYVWGATGPAAYDCSGLMLRSYQAAGVQLPRVSRDQHAGGGVAVAVDDLLPGDLVFFASAAWDPGVVHHVGMYVGDGLMVNAPRPGTYVRVEPISAQGYAGAVRPVPARGRAPAEENEKARRQRERHDRAGDESVTPSVPNAAAPTTSPTAAGADGPAPASSGAPTPAPTPSSSAAAGSGGTPTPSTTATSSVSPSPTPTPTLVAPTLVTPTLVAPTLVAPTRIAPTLLAPSFSVTLVPIIRP